MSTILHLREGLQLWGHESKYLVFGWAVTARLPFQLSPHILRLTRSLHREEGRVVGVSIL